MVPGEMVCRPRIPRVTRFPPQQEAGRRKGELQMHRGFRASLTLSLSRVSTRARSFRQQSCRFWTPILLHSSPPARVLASPGKFRFYFSSFAVISSLFHGSWYCLMRPACSAGKFSWLLQRTVFFPPPLGCS